MLLANPTSLPNVASSYLSVLNFSHSKSLLRQHIEENPFYPSIYGLVSLFKKYQLNCMALDVELNELDELPPPYITILRNQSVGNDFVLVIAKDENTVSISDGGRHVKKIAQNEFKANWMNAVVVAEMIGESDQPGYDAGKYAAKKEQRKRIMAGTLISTVLLLSIILLLHNVPLNYFNSLLFVLFTKFIGLCAGLLLISYEINPYNNIISQVCSVSKRTACGAVLSSGSAGIAGIK